MVSPMNGIFPRILLTVLLIAAGTSFAQQAAPDAGFVAPRPKKTKVETVPVEKPSSYEITGVVKQAVDLKKPLELINPLAPEKYGDGSEDVSWDPDNAEKPKGIVLFGVQW
jgi:hypothetical protein